MNRLSQADLDTLWTFDDADASEQRFRDAIARADGVIAAELRTQLARSLGLQERFDDAHAELDRITSDDPEVRQRIALERGRLLNSAGDSRASIPLFTEALNLDASPFLTIDAVHMLAIADLPHASDWTQRGLELVRQSTDPRTQRWEGALLNNQAWTLADASHFEDALQMFRDALVVFERVGTPKQIHVARWSVAHLARQVGETEEARRILQDLKANDHPDPYVDEELATLDAGID